jgi:NAD(P)-dependent dehydrogenase (short-subunit alcohol dehydrogenase family)
MASPSPVVIVTGASGNLGRAVVAALTAQGAGVVAVDHRRDAASPGAGVTVLGGVDLADEAQAAGAVEAVMSAHGRLDGCVHTVGGFAFARAADADAALFERMFRLNVLTTANLFRAALGPMRVAGRGSLVAIGAGAALKAPAGLAAYAAAKAGVLRIVESFAEEAKADGVRVNAVLPSIIDTPQNRADMPKADTSKWVSPEQLAGVVAFLVSDASSAITGASIPVPGRM